MKVKYTFIYNEIGVLYTILHHNSILIRQKFAYVTNKTLFPPLVLYSVLNIL